MRALSGPGISENDRKNQELHKHAATKSDLILLSPIPFQLEFQTGQRCVPCAMPMPCQSLSIGRCTHFETINPRAFLSKQVFMSASTAVFIFPVFFHTGKLHYCQEGMRVPMCACAQAGVCKWVEAWGWHQKSFSLSNLLTEAESRRWTQNLSIQASRVGLLAPGIPSTFPVLELQACHQSLTQALGTWTLGLRLTRQVL